MAEFRSYEVPLQERSGILLVAIHDRIGAHVGERLDRERRIEAAHRREGRAANDEEVWDVPALPVAIHHRGLRIATHAGAALDWARA
jgi:hypothetical protein